VVRKREREKERERERELIVEQCLICLQVKDKHWRPVGLQPIFITDRMKMRTHFYDFCTWLAYLRA
jgi:hypothetical protein